LPDTSLAKAVIHKTCLLRGQKVMLDRDLVELYAVKPVRFRKQVKRNPGRFPEGVYAPTDGRRYGKHGIAKCDTFIKHLGGYLPFVFTEHEVWVLANMLKSGRTIHRKKRRPPKQIGKSKPISSKLSPAALPLSKYGPAQGYQKNKTCRDSVFKQK
jgi:hypothetical protein